MEICVPHTSDVHLMEIKESLESVTLRHETMHAGMGAPSCEECSFYYQLWWKNGKNRNENAPHSEKSLSRSRITALIHNVRLNC